MGNGHPHGIAVCYIDMYILYIVRVHCLPLLSTMGAGRRPPDKTAYFRFYLPPSCSTAFIDRHRTNFPPVLAEGVHFYYDEEKDGVTAFKGTIRQSLKVFAIHGLALIDALVASPAPKFLVSASL
jgi:hypothetical protein